MSASRRRYLPSSARWGRAHNGQCPRAPWPRSAFSHDSNAAPGLERPGAGIDLLDRQNHKVTNLDHDRRHDRGASPLGMVLASLEEHDIARGDLDPLMVLPRHPAASRQNNEELAVARLMSADHPARFKVDEVGAGFTLTLGQTKGRCVMRVKFRDGICFVCQIGQDPHRVILPCALGALSGRRVRASWRGPRANRPGSCSR